MPPGSESPRLAWLRAAAALLAVTASLAGGLGAQAARNAPVLLEGPRRVWHTLTLSFATVVDTHESLHPPGANPFLDFRLDVTFSHAASGTSLVVPGFYAADGRAADTSAAAGNVWQAHFTPDRAGVWEWSAAFRRGPGIALDAQLAGSTADARVDGSFGTFHVAPADPQAPGLLGLGRLTHAGERYLHFAQGGARFLKSGAGGPENLLAYFEIDGTLGDPGSLCLAAPTNPERLHRFAAHTGDFLGDAVGLRHTWGSPARGQNLLGALDYLASVGVNSFFFLLHGYQGDGNDVWPFVAATDKAHFDVSKLDQWERVLAHMTARGIVPQVSFEEDENDLLPESQGGLGVGLTPTRRLYYREMIARFAHHPALLWVVGEESNYYDQVATMQALALAIRDLDPYDHPLAFHGKHPCVGAGCPQEYPIVVAQYQPYFPFEAFDYTSFQTVPGAFNQSTVQLVEAQLAGRKWAHFGDEQSLNAIPANLTDNRRRALWGNLMAGGAGVSWYPGNAIVAQYTGGAAMCDYYDIAIEDLRRMESYFLQTAHAVAIFHQRLPFAAMLPANHLAAPNGAQDYVLQRPEQGATRAVYAVYRGTGSAATLALGPGEHTVEWFDPRSGAGLIAAPSLFGPGTPLLPPPAQDPGQDWLAIVRQQ